MNPYLTLVEAKHVGKFVTAWAQMMAYIGMVHRNRVPSGKQNVTVYGICSVEMRYRFAMVDSNGLVSAAEAGLYD